MAALVLLITFRPSSSAALRHSAAQLSTEKQYQAVLLQMQRQAYPAAFAECQRLLEIAPAMESAYLRYAELAIETGRIEEAAQFIQRLPNQSPTQQALKHYGLAAVYFPRQFPNDASYRRAVEHCLQSLSFKQDFFRPYPLLVEAQIALHQEESLQKYLTAALDLLLPAKAAAHYGLGYFYKVKGQYAESVEQLNEAFILAPNFLEALHEKGAVLLLDRSNNNNQIALKLGTQLLQTAQAEANLEYQIKGLKIIGYAHNQSNQPREAVQTYREGLRIAELTGELFLQDYLLAVLCNTHTASEDYANSIAACRRGLLLTSSKVTEYNLGNLGLVYRRLGDTPSGKNYYSKALELARRKNNVAQQMRMLTNLGEVEAELKHFDDSQKLLNEALKLAVQQNDLQRKSAALASLGRLYDESGDYANALASQLAAKQLAEGMDDKEQVARSLNSLGLVYAKQGNWKAALQVHAQAAQIGRQNNYVRAVWLAQRGMAASYRQLGQFEQAEQQYRRAIEVQETTRSKLREDSDKVGFWQDKVKLYKDLISLLLPPARANQMASKRTVLPVNAALNAKLFQLAEQWRARAFLDLLVESSLRSTAGNLDDALHRPLGLAETQQLLDEQTVVLAYSLDQKSSLLFGISHNSSAVYQLDGEADLNACLTKLLNALVDKTQVSPDDYRQEASALYDKLLAPARALLIGKKHLIIVSDGLLQRLPFEVLLRAPVRKGAAADPADWPYLIKDFSISYAPSVSIWAQLHHRVAHYTKAPKAFIAFGNPLYPPETQGSFASLLGGATLSPLRYSQGEVERIGALFGKDNPATLYLGAQANEAAVKSAGVLNQYRFVHFSLHANVNEANPRFSGLLLSPSLNSGTTPNGLSQEDGILTAAEIMNLRLNAELVSLSACETGLGKQINGEGLMGMMRAFIYAGTPAVAVSLWKVDERATAELMVHFYEYLLRGKKLKDGRRISLNKAEALQAAQLDAIKAGNAPYYWAPFVLAGHP